MDLPFFKSLFPRSLMGRAMAILLVPIVTLQLIVGLVFFERHYQKVTEQMTRNIARPLDQAIREAERAGSAAEAAMKLTVAGGQLGFSITLSKDDTVIPWTRRTWMDLTGRTIVTTIRAELQRPVAVDLATSPRMVKVSAQSGHGVITGFIPRNQLSVSNPHQLLVLMIISAMILTTVAVLFLRNQVRPIRRLAAASDAFGKGRILDLHPSGAEEVRLATRAFLSMRQRIERHIDQRTLMLSGVSHDLRTPLTRMKLTLALMEESDDVADLQKDVDQMDRMLGAFLDFASGDQTEPSVPTDPVALLRDLIADNQRNGHDISLIIQTPENGGMVALRPDGLRRALQNILNNARRYATATRVKLRLLPRSLSIIVEDNGPGIPLEARDAALQPFNRLDEARDPNTEANVGLGLSIALDIARGHGGNLTLTQSTELGGLRVDLRIPR